MSSSDEQEWPLRDWATRLRPSGGLDDDTDAGSVVPPAGAEEQPPATQPPGTPPGLADLPVDQEDYEVVFDSSLEPAAAGDEEPGYAEPAYDEPAGAEPLVEDVAEAPPYSTVAAAIAPALEEHAAGDFSVPAGYETLEGVPAGDRRTVAVVVSRFNGAITTGMLESALAELEEAGVQQTAVLVLPVPGAFELPLAAMALAKTRRYSCVVALGCIVRGETPHFDYVASEAASGLQLAAIETGVPVAFGVLTCDTVEQAEARIGKGAEAARTALEMADVFAQHRVSVAAGRAAQ